MTRRPSSRLFLALLLGLVLGSGCTELLPGTDAMDAAAIPLRDGDVEDSGRDAGDATLARDGGRADASRDGGQRDAGRDGGVLGGLDAAEADAVVPIEGDPIDLGIFTSGPNAPPDVTVRSEMQPAYSTVQYVFTVEGPSTVYAEIFVPSRPSCDHADLVLELFDGRESLGEDDDDGEGYCPRIDPITDRFASVGAGVYRLKVRSYQASKPIPAFELVLRVVSFATTVDTMRFTGALMPGERDAYPIDVPSRSQLRISTWAPAEPNCVGNADTVVELVRSSTRGEVLVEDDDDGERTCSLIDPRIDANATVDPGVYVVRVRAYSNSATIDAYELVVERFSWPSTDVGDGGGGATMQDAGARDSGRADASVLDDADAGRSADGEPSADALDAVDAGSNEGGDGSFDAETPD